MKVLNALMIVSVFLIGSYASAQSKEEKETEKFNLIDGDKNEVITIREMVKFYKDKTNNKGETIDAKRLFYGLDANKNSIITLNEYIVGVDWELANEFKERWDKKEVVVNEAPKKSDYEQRQTEKFETIDTNNNKELSIAEVVTFHKGKINKETGEPVNAKLTFYAYDGNEDGKILLEEYVKRPNWKMGWKRYEESIKETDSTKVKKTSEGYVKKRITLFYEVDTDKNYKITLEELEAYYKGQTNKKGKPINAEFKFYGLDTNEDGSIELAEFTEKIDVDFAKRKYKARKQ